MQWGQSEEVLSSLHSLAIDIPHWSISAHYNCRWLVSFNWLAHPSVCEQPCTATWCIIWLLYWKYCLVLWSALIAIIQCSCFIFSVHIILIWDSAHVGHFDLLTMVPEIMTFILKILTEWLFRNPTWQLL